MTLGLWIVLSLLAWTLVPLPLAVLVGRFIRIGAESGGTPVGAPVGAQVG